MEVNIQDEKMAFENAWLVPHELEFFDFDLKKNQYLLKEQYVSDDESPIANETYHSLNSGWSMWLKAKAHEAEKLNGCVVVPESEYNDMAQYKDIYKRAIVNAKKRKNQINWAHVAGLGVGSGRAVELCKELKIDPHATDMNAMLEAARGEND